MTEITDLMKCPDCHRRGTMELTLRKKNAEATCRACDAIVTSRIPYPDNRYDAFVVPSIKGRRFHA